MRTRKTSDARELARDNTKAIVSKRGEDATFLFFKPFSVSPSSLESGEYFVLELMAVGS